MITVQITKKLNNTELGKAGTHDTYILIPQNLDISDLFPDVNQVYIFIDRQTGEEVPIRHTSGREKRIVGLGPYYAKKDLCACDEIILEVRTIGDKICRTIDCIKKDNLFVVQKSSVGFEILIPDRMDLLTDVHIESGEELTIEYLTSKRKRQDSPVETDFYDLKIGGQSLKEKYAGKELVEIEINQKVAYFNRFCAWTKSIVETEETK